MYFSFAWLDVTFYIHTQHTVIDKYQLNKKCEYTFLIISLSKSLKSRCWLASLCSVHAESFSSWRGNMKSLFTVIYNGIQVGMTLNLNAVHMLCMDYIFCNNTYTMWNLCSLLYICVFCLIQHMHSDFLSLFFSLVNLPCSLLNIFVIQKN